MTNANSQVIEGRNTQQIREDDLIDSHTELKRLLNATVAGYVLYRGAQREKMVKLLARMAYAIENGDATPESSYSMFNTPWAVLVTLSITLDVR